MADIATKVIDASALIAVIFGEAAADNVAVRVRGCSLVAPAILDFELVNACISKMRRTPADRDRLLAAYRCSLDDDRRDNGCGSHGGACTCSAHRLDGYDASYLFGQDAEVDW